MKTSELEREIVRGIVLAGCAYEIVALTTRKIPTITRILRTVGSKRYGRAAVWLWVGYIAWHFLEPIETDEGLSNGDNL